MSDEIYTLESEGGNEGADHNGSYQMIMEIINSLNMIDRNNQLILDYHLIIHYQDDPDPDIVTEVQEYECVGNMEDGSPIIVDKTTIDTFSNMVEKYKPYSYNELIKLLKSKVTETDWMDEKSLQPIVDECARLIRSMCGDYLIGAIVRYPHEFLDAYSFEYDDINKFFRCFKIPFSIRITHLYGAPHFLIREYKWDEDK